jgi:peptide/nickel transport system substrate-binding protein
VAHPFWTTDYVGLGPFRVTNWELGSFLEGAAFDGHALGRPKIDRVKLLFTTDPNIGLTNLLSDTAQVAIDNAIQVEQAATLDREWGAHNGGTVLRSPSAVRGAHFQLRPEYANPRAALDVRIRRAVAHATDRQSLADALTNGTGSVADSFLLPQVEYYADVERNVMTYPYDPRRAEQLFGEAGFTKGSDGFFASPTDGRFPLEIAVTDANPTEGTIMVDGLRRTGVDASLRVIPRAQTTEPMIFASYPGILNGQLNGAFAPPLTRFRASELPRPENRYLGSNFAGFNNPEFERLATAWESTLNRAERNQQSVQMVTLLSQEVPAYPLFYYQVMVAFASSVRGPIMAVSSASGSWNIHEWEWTN